MTNQDRARQILQRLMSIYPSTLGSIGADDEPGQRLEAAIAAALAQREHMTWLAAARIAGTLQVDPPGPTAQWLVEIYHTKAQAVQP